MNRAILFDEGVNNFISITPMHSLARWNSINNESISLVYDSHTFVRPYISSCTYTQHSTAQPMCMNSTYMFFNRIIYTYAYVFNCCLFVCTRACLCVRASEYELVYEIDVTKKHVCACVERSETKLGE